MDKKWFMVIMEPALTYGITKTSLLQILNKWSLVCSKLSVLIQTVAFSLFPISITPSSLHKMIQLCWVFLTIFFLFRISWTSLLQCTSTQIQLVLISLAFRDWLLVINPLYLSSKYPSTIVAPPPLFLQRTLTAVVFS